jgi:hypothetical protein
VLAFEARETQRSLNRVIIDKLIGAPFSSPVSTIQKKTRSGTRKAEKEATSPRKTGKRRDSIPA